MGTEPRSTEGMGVGERWEKGIPHDPRSVALYKSIEALDFEQGDYFGFKSGGDGDNGEHLMYLLDMHFARSPAGARDLRSADDPLREPLDGPSPGVSPPEPCAEPVKGSKAWHEIQGLRGYNARLRIEMDIIDRLLDGTADDDLTSIDMEYWIPVHDRIRALVRKSSPEPVAKPNPCRNECSLISLDDDHWKCNHCDAVFAYTGAQKPVEKPRCWWPLCKETAGDALCDAVQSALTKGAQHD